MLRCSNGLRHVILNVLTAPWGENNIFGFFGVVTQIEGKQNMVSTLGPQFLHQNRILPRRELLLKRRFQRGLVLFLRRFPLGYLLLPREVFPHWCLDRGGSFHYPFTNYIFQRPICCPSLGSWRWAFISGYSLFHSLFCY